ncbi:MULTISPECIES: HIT family protein [unclassified Roseitalea]|uniref:HIT family protein n=1 Tax=unclassified Roseitalea TaxID=2639107 RepID=UPI00273FCF89|nr:MULTISPECIES: HIT family protein [unclassified Roseitalea]
MVDYDPDNIFARILRGDIPSHKVHEDDDTLVIMDAMPQAPGHALVIPKSPCRNLLDAEPMALGAAIAVVQRVARASMAAFGADGITVLQFNEPAGGQSVFHLHFHVIPRHDGVALKPHSGEMESNDVLAGNALKLREALADL